jgi:hypothetical protein
MAALEKFTHPFALVGQGFAVGALLFFATQPGALQAATSAAHSVVSANSDAARG